MFFKDVCKGCVVMENIERKNLLELSDSVINNYSRLLALMEALADLEEADSKNCTVIYLISELVKKSYYKMKKAEKIINLL